MNLGRKKALISFDLSGPESFVSSLADTFLNETKEKVLHCNASFVLLSILHRLPNHKVRDTVGVAIH